MNCKKVNKLLVRYLEEDLNKQDKFFLEKHLQECKQCEKELILLKEILETARLEKMPSPSEDYWTNYPARLEQKIESSKNLKKLIPRKEWINPLKWAIPVIAVILLIVYFYPSYQQKVSTTLPLQVDEINHSQQTQTRPIQKISQRNSPKTIAKAEAPQSSDVDANEIIDSLYAQAIEIENALEEKEENYFSLIDELTDEEKEDLITKIKETFLLSLQGKGIE